MSTAADRMDPRRRRTTDALLRAAQRLFADAGVEDVTVDEIAREAGVAVGSIYNNFGSKAGLYVALADRALDLDREYMDRAYVADRSPVEQLLAAAEEYLRFALDHPHLFRMLAFPPEAGSYAAAADTARRMSERIDEQNRRMVDALERGIADGSIRPLDPRATATVLWATWNGIISLHWREDDLREDAESVRALLVHAAEIVGFGLRTGPPPG